MVPNARSCWFILHLISRAECTSSAWLSLISAWTSTPSYYSGDPFPPPVVQAQMPLTMSQYTPAGVLGQARLVRSRPDLGHSSLSPVNNPGAHPSLHAPHHSTIALFLSKCHSIRTSAWPLLYHTTATSPIQEIITHSNQSLPHLPVHDHNPSLPLCQTSPTLVSAIQGTLLSQELEPWRDDRV